MSPIHDQGYRRYGGQRTPPGRAWSVIAKAGIRTLLAKRAFIGLLLMSWLPFIVRTVQIYAATSLPQAAFLAPDARMFRQFLEQQEVFLFFSTIYAGAGLIASDRRANALQIYLSKTAEPLRIHLREADDPGDVSSLRDVGAGRVSAGDPNRDFGQLQVFSRQPVPVSGHHDLLVHPGLGRRIGDARPVVAFQ
jgi:hypothetical protein